MVFLSLGWPCLPVARITPTRSAKPRQERFSQSAAILQEIAPHAQNQFCSQRYSQGRQGTSFFALLRRVGSAKLRVITSNACGLGQNRREVAHPRLYEEIKILVTLSK